jgi:hypothetical protein
MQMQVSAVRQLEKFQKHEEVTGDDDGSVILTY